MKCWCWCDEFLAKAGVRLCVCACACVRVRVWECVLGMYSCLNKIVMHTIHVSPLLHDWALQTGESQKERDEKREREREKNSSKVDEKTTAQSMWMDYSVIYGKWRPWSPWKGIYVKSMERDYSAVHGKGLPCSTWKILNLCDISSTRNESGWAVHGSRSSLKWTG